MCGRYTLTKPSKTIQSHFAPVRVRMEIKERYNIAPSQELPAVVFQEGHRELLPMRWGLIPPWAREGKTVSAFINAKAETLHEKPSFKNSFREKRCLVPADGFMEWGKTPAGKTPYYLFLKSHELFAFAGIWSMWKEGGTPRLTYSIITTQPNSLVQSIHHRMPVILAPRDYGTWLNPESKQDVLRSLLVPFPSDSMDMYEISKEINSPKNDRAECLRPLSSGTR
ncbi:MAG: SOS response-associated peptidase [Nitrospinaceae bacterium]